MPATETVPTLPGSNTGVGPQSDVYSRDADIWNSSHPGMTVTADYLHKTVGDGDEQGPSTPTIPDLRTPEGRATWQQGGSKGPAIHNDSSPFYPGGGQGANQDLQNIYQNNGEEQTIKAGGAANSASVDAIPSKALPNMGYGAERHGLTVLPTVPSYGGRPLTFDNLGEVGRSSAQSYRQMIETRARSSDRYDGNDALSREVRQYRAQMAQTQQQEDARRAAETKYPDRYARGRQIDAETGPQVDRINAQTDEATARGGAATANAQTAAQREKDQNARALDKAAAAAGVEQDRVNHWKAQETAHKADRAQAEQDFQQRQKLLQDKIAAGTATEKDRQDHRAVEDFRYATDARRRDATTRIGDILAHMATLVDPNTKQPNDYGKAPADPANPTGPSRYAAAHAQVDAAQKEREGIDFYLKYQGYSPTPDPAKWPGPDGTVRQPTTAPTSDPGGSGAQTGQTGTQGPGAAGAGGNGRVGQAVPPNTPDGDYPTKDGGTIVTVKGGKIVAERPK